MALIADAFSGGNLSNFRGFIKVTGFPYMAHVIVVTIASNKQAFITPLHTHYFGNTTAVGHGILTSVTKP